jgi:predicted TIM-barrel fold metal-dependent hydrolase
MIIDLHTQVWSNLDQLGREVAERVRQSMTQRWGQLDASPPAHEAAMGYVDGSLVFGFRSDRLGACVPNEFIAEFVSRDPRRLAGVAGIDPMSDDGVDQFDRAMALGMVGVTVSPASQGFHPAHSDAMLIYERCVQSGVPLFVTLGDPLAGSAMLEFARPAMWDEVARSFPQLPIVITQLGHPWIDETLLLLGKHDNMYADISGVASRPWQLYNALVAANSFGVMSKLLFGSGFPRETPAKTIESLYTVNTFSHGTHLPSVPRSQIRGIIERDALATLGIEASVHRALPAKPATGSPELPQEKSSQQATAVSSTQEG